MSCPPGSALDVLVLSVTYWHVNRELHFNGTRARLRFVSVGDRNATTSLQLAFGKLLAPGRDHAELLGRKVRVGKAEVSVQEREGN